MDLGVEPPSITLCLGTSPPRGGGNAGQNIYIYDNEAHMRCYLQMFQYWAGGALLSPH